MCFRADGPAWAPEPSQRVWLCRPVDTEGFPDHFERYVSFAGNARGA